MTGTECIRHRRSVRTFDGSVIDEAVLHRILEFAQEVRNPYDIPISWKILDAKKDSLSSPVITGTDKWITGKIAKVLHAEEAFGYSFEKVVLFAESLGLGTTWIGGTMDRQAFEKAISLSENEIMPCVSPLGYPAKKMSLRESLMRKGVKADSRLEFPELFFDGSFDKPITEDTAGDLKAPFEMVRLGPSAVNKQPWRLVKCGNTVHFYEKRGIGSGRGEWDVQKIDIGIAMSHFEIATEECGMNAIFFLGDPGLEVPDSTSYIASYELK